MNNEIVLSLRNLSKRFGSVVAVDDVDLDLHRGEVLALLGENGAGKTTLMNMLFGHYLPDAGSVQLRGADGGMHDLPLGHPQLALEAGIGMVHQHFTLAENLTALDNILLGAEPLFRLRRNRTAARERVQKIISDTGLVAPLDEAVGRLSVGERQRVEILKALYRNARILVLDEPTAVLTPQEADALFENIGAMTRNGLSVIFISHKLREVLAFSDRIAVLRRGRKVGEMPTSSADGQSIAEMMVGAQAPATALEPMEPGQVLLELRDVSVKGGSPRESLHSASLMLRAHEIVGIAGVSGNGQTGLANLVSGLAPPSAGQFLVGGRPIERFAPRHIMDAGIGRIPEDRHKDGVVGSMTVAENLIIERLDAPEFRKNGFLRRANIRAHAEKLSAAYDIRGPGVDAKAQLLSGGNLQKLILARVFEAGPKVILANQPTRGLDMGAAAEVARRLLEARSRGAGVILISEDLDEIMALSDRIMVINNGSLREVHTTDRNQIGLMMAGEAA
ncbi:MAG: ABC transporter ATP-binding protein [Paracoccaceae bacterium]|nr:ABC transporter ATP-binding protein [Paracoccaceae bacterium]